MVAAARDVPAPALLIGAAANGTAGVTGRGARSGGGGVDHGAASGGGRGRRGRGNAAAAGTDNDAIQWTKL